MPSFADWREEIGTLRVGIVAGDDISRKVAQTEPFRLAIQESLDIPVEIFGARDLPSLIRAHSDGRVEYAVMPASAYAATFAACQCLETLVVAKSGDGSGSFRSVIVTRKQGGVKSAENLRGKTVIALSEDSLGGYAFALYELAKSGIDLAAPDTKIIFGKTAHDSVEKFAAGEGDALIGWSSMTGDADTGYTRGTLKLLAEKTGGSVGAYQVIWSSTPIPQRVHSVSRKIPGEAKAALRVKLSKLFEEDPVAYDAIEPVYGGGFETIRHSGFEALIDFAKSASQDGVNTIADEEASKKTVGKDNAAKDKAPEEERVSR